MIIEHIVQGSRVTSLHDFEISVAGMEITITPGNYYRAGNLVFSKDTETKFTIPNDHKKYQVCITDNGIELFSFTDEQGYVIVPDLIDKLVWFSVNDETDLVDVDVHFMKLIGS
jgi:hypothetical protein